jgi:hypothetical protein
MRDEEDRKIRNPKGKPIPAISGCLWPSLEGGRKSDERGTMNDEGRKFDRCRTTVRSLFVAEAVNQNNKLKARWGLSCGKRDGAWMHHSLHLIYIAHLIILDTKFTGVSHASMPMERQAR